MSLRILLLFIAALMHTPLLTQPQLYTAADVERSYKVLFNEGTDHYAFVDAKVADSIRALGLRSTAVITESISEEKKTLNRSILYYDETGRLVKHIERGQHPSSVMASYSPDGRSMLCTITAPGTQQVRDSFYFNAQRSLVKWISWNKGQLPKRYFYAYDESQRLIQFCVVEGEEHKTVELRYTSHNKPASRLEMRGKADGPADTVNFTQVEYDAQWRIVSMQTTAYGMPAYNNTVKPKTRLVFRRWHTYRYDDDGRLLLFGERWTGYTINGVVKTSETSVDYIYGKDGQLWKEEFHSSDTCPPWSWKEHHYSATGDTVFTYGCKLPVYADSRSMPRQGPVARLSAELFIKDKAGRLIERQELLEWHERWPGFKVWERQLYTYNAAGHLIEKRFLRSNTHYDDPYSLYQYKFNEKGLKVEATEFGEGQLKEQSRFEYSFY